MYLEEYNLQKIDRVDQGWTQNICLTVSHSSNYTTVCSVLVWGCNWVLFMHGWFNSIRLIHLIVSKSHRFKKK